MKTQEVVASVGVGTLCILSGSVLLGIALVQLLVTVASAIPIWIAYAAVSGVLLLLGYLLLKEGKDEAEEQIEETLDIKHQAADHPLISIGVAAIAGYTLSTLVTKFSSAIAPSPSEPKTTSSRSTGSRSNGRKHQNSSTNGHDSPATIDEEEDDDGSMGAMAQTAVYSLLTSLSGKLASDVLHSVMSSPGQSDPVELMNES